MNREQSQVIATGASFSQVKSAAAAHGERSVLIGQLPAARRWLRRSRHCVHFFAVFIAVAQPLDLAQSASGASAPATAKTER